MNKPFAEIITNILEGQAAPWRPIQAREAASLIGVTTQTLANWRFSGRGPMAASDCVSGRQVLYRPSAIAAWAAEKLGLQTTEDEMTQRWLTTRGTVVGSTKEVTAKLDRLGCTALVEKVKPCPGRVSGLAALGKLDSTAMHGRLCPLNHT